MEIKDKFTSKEDKSTKGIIKTTKAKNKPVVLITKNKRNQAIRANQKRLSFFLFLIKQIIARLTFSLFSLAYGERKQYTIAMAKLKLDLHDIYNKGQQIDKELERIVNEAIEKKIKLIEIIPGKGSGQLKKKVLRFLEQKHIKKLYHRIDKDSKNFGRLFVHFKF